MHCGQLTVVVVDCLCAVTCQYIHGRANCEDYGVQEKTTQKKRNTYVYVLHLLMFSVRINVGLVRLGASPVLQAGVMNALKK